ncbi:MAG TPA: response regulator [Blastocatellia bacterium]|jgi:response regulator RpfG family c-di-GMP phosphodiesterase|nr:response regulator [Blastocatellia bacterium]
MTYTILAVDDEPANLRMLERLFRRDYRLITASNGEEALEVLKREDVSLIITDQRMPGMSGTQLLRESMGTNPHTIKIILTGYTDIEALVEAINTTRIHKFVSKPWDPVALKMVVQDAFREHEKYVQQRQLLETLTNLVRSCPAIFSLEGEAGDPSGEIANENALRNMPAEPVN